jgi:phenylpyruvate tautomerase PptA (4-oxalocrotonate tautomerase family)
MPIVKVSLAKGKSKNFLKGFNEELIESIMSVLKIPADELLVLINEYEKEQFAITEPYEFLIEIVMFSGRSSETKKLLFSTIVEKLNERLNIDKQSAYICINEQPMDNWGFKGGQSAADIFFNFKN